jgi:hypothetical protein
MSSTRRAAHRSFLILATRLLAVALLFAVAAPASAEKEKSSYKAPRAEMQQVFEAIAQLLPLSLSEAKWSDPARRAEIETWLDQLSSRALVLEKHAEGRDAGFRNLSRSLSSDIQEIRSRFKAGRYEESRFFMIEATGNCVACHSRLPSERSFPMAARLTSQIEFDNLSAHEKTQILVATRQFDAALDVWEKAFADPLLTPGQLDMDGYLLDYFTIAIRVKNDPARVKRTLRKFEKRKDMPRYLKRHVDSWIRAIDATAGDLESKDQLGRARTLVLGGDQPRPGPLGREQTIYDLVASSLLLRFIDHEGIADIQLAEAYYLLGLVESRSVDSYWVPQAEFHLESAIRLAPQADFSEHAYAILEEYIIIGHGGASGSDLPADEWAKLNELRNLIDAKRAAARPKTK